MPGKRLRLVLFWLHLTSGILAGVVVLIMSLTGIALTYQRQLQWWADTRHYRALPSQGAERLPASMLVEAAGRLNPDALATTLTLRADPSAPAAVAFGGRTVYVNPYTAHVYGEGTGGGVRAFFAEMIAWHRYLAMTGEARPAGRALTGASNLLFLFLVLSGLYLWWPRAFTRLQLRPILWFRRGVQPKARHFNWHHVLGFWSAIPLAIVVASATVISYPWASTFVYRAFGEAPPAPPAGVARGTTASDGRTASAGRTAERNPRARAPHGRVDALMMRATTFEPAWTILSLRLPAEATGTTTATIDRGDGGQPQLRGTLTLDVPTAEVRSWDGFSTQTPGRRARSFLRFAHTGEYFGLAGQTVAGLVSAAAVVLVYTGLSLSLRRLQEWRGRRRRLSTGRRAA
jgi:uncharacterized iron-regulated membrane protein